MAAAPMASKFMLQTDLDKVFTPFLDPDSAGIVHSYMRSWPDKNQLFTVADATCAKVSPDGTHIAVSSTHQSKVTVVDMMGDMCDLPGEFQWPAGVAYHRDGTLLVINTTQNHMALYDREHGGDQGPVYRFTGKCNLPKSKNPCVPAIVGLDRVVVSDWRSETVNIYSRSGKLVRSRKMSEHQGDCSPFGVAVDSRGRILVGDREHHAVLAFDSELKDLLATYKNNERFRWIEYLAVNRRDEIAVSDSKEIHLLSSDGKRVGALQEGPAMGVDFVPDSDHFVWASQNLNQVAVQPFTEQLFKREGSAKGRKAAQRSSKHVES